MCTCHLVLSAHVWCLCMKILWDENTAAAWSATAQILNQVDEEYCEPLRNYLTLSDASNCSAPVQEFQWDVAWWRRQRPATMADECCSIWERAAIASDPIQRLNLQTTGEEAAGLPRTNHYCCTRYEILIYTNIVLKLSEIDGYIHASRCITRFSSFAPPSYNIVNPSIFSPPPIIPLFFNLVTDEIFCKKQNSFIIL